MRTRGPEPGMLQAVRRCSCESTYGTQDGESTLAKLEYEQLTHSLSTLWCNVLSNYEPSRHKGETPRHTWRSSNRTCTANVCSPDDTSAVRKAAQSHGQPLIAQVTAVIYLLAQPNSSVGNASKA